MIREDIMRPEILHPVFMGLNTIKGVGERSLKLLSNLAGDKVIDLLWHLPANIIDRRSSPSLREAVSGRIYTLKVRVIDHLPPKTKKHPYRVVVEEVHPQAVVPEQLTLVFFKVYADSIHKNLPIGAERVISGKLDNFNGGWQMSHPDFIAKSEDFEKLKSVEPVYPLTAGITNKMICKWMPTALAKLPQLPEWIDSHLLKQKGWNSFNSSLLVAHHPQSLDDLSPASLPRVRLAYDELLANQLSLAFARDRSRKKNGRIIKGNGHLRQKVITTLPFQLTNAQKRVLEEIYADQETETKMLRLVQGDVGSGKTIVALLAMLNAVECSCQAAIMAPTEILARQHFETIAPICDTLGLKVGILTGRNKGKERKKLLSDLADGFINILIGTHALFQEDVTFNDLACVVIDEQHRFGVQQRLGLSKKGDRADVLVMTATPIPRSLVLTAYGDMDYSQIDEVPPERKPVDTRVISLEKISDVVHALQRKIISGSRAYWVCPLVEESEKSDLAAAKERFESLQKIFGEDVGLVHGKMKDAEKDDVMTRFKNGDIKLLVATTVIEVGVNVPEATVMVIEHAERFGLAQLHQLRGRIKRGIEASSCLLLYGYPLSETARERLNIMRETENGFLIAEKDLELRGGGEILGTRQSGFCSFRLADMSVHKDLLHVAHQDAKLIINTDPQLSTSRGEALRILLYLFERDNAIKTYTAG